MRYFEVGSPLHASVEDLSVFSLWQRSEGVLIWRVCGGQGTGGVVWCQ